jgi:hypothetical protein
MHAGREIVIIQLPPTSGRNHFPGLTKTSGNKGLRTWLLTKQGQPSCNSSSSSFGTSHAADSLPESMSGRPGDDRDFSRYPCPGQCGHLRRARAGCLPRRLGSQRNRIRTKLRPEGRGPQALPQRYSSDAGGLSLSVQLKSVDSGSVARERAFSGSPSW